jgi:hypothetical protein
LWCGGASPTVSEHTQLPVSDIKFFPTSEDRKKLE